MDLTPIHIDGHMHVIATPTDPLIVAGESAVRTAYVSDDIDELTNPAMLRTALESMLASVKRRQIRPKGYWAVGYLPVDFPTWQEFLDPALAAQVAAKAQEINGHVIVFALVDTATLSSDSAT